MAYTLKVSQHMREVLRGASIAFVLRVVGAGLAFGFTVLLARILGAEGAGVYYLALTVTTIAAMIGRIGLDNALLRFTATHASQEDWPKVAGIYRKGMYVAGLGSTFTALFVLVSAPWIAKGIFSEPELTQPLRLMALGILPLSLLLLHAELLKGLKRIRDAVFIKGVGIPLISIPLLALLGGSLGVIGATMAYVAATILVLSLAVVFWRHATPRLSNLRGTFDTRMLLGTSIQLFWVTSIVFILNWTDTFMLGIMTDSKSVGIYGVAIRTARLATFILMAVNAITAPKYASLYETGDRQALQSVAQGTARLVTFATLPLIALFMFAPGFVLGIFGASFKAGATTLIVLAGGQLVNLMAGSVVYLLLMSGKQKVVGQTITGATVVNVVLNYILIGRLGILGAGIATAATMIITNLVLAWKVYQELGIVSMIVPTAKPVLEESQL